MKITRRVTPGIAGYVVILTVGAFAPTLAVLGYLAIALFLLVPVRELRASGPRGVEPVD